MKDIRLPKFRNHDNFVNLSDVVESHAKQDLLWTEELTKMTNVRPGQVKQFSKHPIRA